MSTNQFRLSIGAKRQVTLPAELLDQLRVPERGELLIEVIGDHAVVTPMVSVPRAPLPEELRRTFESRRGAQPSDVPLAQFLKEVGYQAPAHQTAAPPLSEQEHLASLTPNERKSLGQTWAAKSSQPAELARMAEIEPSELGSERSAGRHAPRQMGLTPREREVLAQVTDARSPRQIAHALGLAEDTVKAHLANIERKLGKVRMALPEKTRSAER
ncbi:MAG TPA: LuxR C-terminal-related transcriptional regulator [Acidobacteriaceae bacterium]|jgi:DNA-binding CsgD family transcriptional regulator/bifunctional DNA-binding transcriptional regulator/antitoxin component of YhaV-PrlF toxin-antitoxin module